MKEELRNKFINLEKTMNSYVMEREREIHGMILAMLAGEHIYVGGPPGSGKSYMGKVMLSLIEGATDFSNTFTAFSTPDEVVGPFDPAELMKGNMKRSGDGMLQTAHFARLEEIFKSNAGCLGILTDILVDGMFVENGKASKVPLIQAMATSNELPQDDSLQYLWDRFAVRYWVDYLRSKDNRKKALGLRKGVSMPSAIITLDELIEVRKLVKDTPVSESLQDILLEVQEGLKSEGFVMSDRRLGRLQEIAHADMVVFGTSEEEAAAIVADGAWMEQSQQKRVREIVFEKANPTLSILMNILDRAQVAIDECVRIKGQQIDSSRKIDEIGKRTAVIRGLQGEVFNLKATRKTEEAKAELSAKEAEIKGILMSIIRGM